MASTARRSIIPQSARGGGQAAQARGAGGAPGTDNHPERREPQNLDEEIKGDEADNENDDEEQNQENARL